MIPNRLQSGQNFKSGVVNKINAIIEYLKTQRISGDNKTIQVTQNTSGLSIHAIGGGTSSPKSGGAVIALGILTTSPNTAFGPAAYKKTKFDANGGHNEQSNSTPTIVPYMGGYYGV